MLASDWSRESINNDQRGYPLRYGGTFGIDCSMPFVPDTFRRLGTNGGTFGIDWSMPFVPDTFRRLGTNGGGAIEING